MWGDYCGWKLDWVEQTQLKKQAGNLHPSPDIAHNLTVEFSQIP